MKKKNPLVAYHDHVAGLYDTMYQDDYWNFYRQLTWKIIKNHLPKNFNDPILDFGCGTGYWGLKLAKSGYKVTFVDISIKMLEQARRKLYESELENECQFIHADICELSKHICDQKFSFLIGEGDPLSLCSHPERALKEIRHIMLPHATIVTSVDNACSGLDHFVNNSDIGGLELFLKNGKTDWLAKDPQERFETTMFTPEKITTLFKKVGFENISIRGKTILPVRKNKEILKDSKSARKLIDIEMKLNGKPDYFAKASHLQVIAQLLR